MKFIKLKKRKFYETWVGKKCKCKVYIFRCKDDLFHFTSISCKGEIYSSLYDNLIYNDFELCSGKIIAKIQRRNWNHAI